MNAIVVTKRVVSFLELCVEAKALGLSMRTLAALARGEAYIDIEYLQVFVVGPDGETAIRKSGRGVAVRPTAGEKYEILTGSFHAVNNG